MASYVVVAMRATGSVRQIERTFKSAPSEAVLARTFRGRGRDQDYDLAIRYYPSRKGWMIVDLRNAYKKQLVSGREYWTGTRRSPKAYPNEAAAIMKAIYILNPPSQGSLSL